MNKVLIHTNLRWAQVVSSCWLFCLLLSVAPNFYAGDITRDSGQEYLLINALFIPLADNYPALVAYEGYRDLLRGYVQSGEMDMAYMLSPLVMDKFWEQAHFLCNGLMHRDGNAQAINDLLYHKIQPASLRTYLKLDMEALKTVHKELADIRFYFDGADQEMDNDRV